MDDTRRFGELKLVVRDKVEARQDDRIFRWFFGCSEGISHTAHIAQLFNRVSALQSLSQFDDRIFAHAEDTRSALASSKMLRRTLSLQ